MRNLIFIAMLAACGNPTPERAGVEALTEAGYTPVPTESERAGTCYRLNEGLVCFDRQEDGMEALAVVAREDDPDALRKGAYGDTVVSVYDGAMDDAVKIMSVIYDHN